jgi:hypothetical protein
MTRHFTPVERKMLAVLGDGRPHARPELHACLYDDLGTAANIRWHVMNLRRKLALFGETVFLEADGRYRWGLTRDGAASVARVVWLSRMTMPARAV